MYFKFLRRKDDRRREQRHPIQKSETVRVTVAVAGGADAEATLVDVSEHGLGLRLNEMVPAGSQIEVRWKRLVFFGNIRYCRETLDGLRAGVTITYVRLPERHGILCDWTEYLDEMLASETGEPGRKEPRSRTL